MTAAFQWQMSNYSNFVTCFSSKLTELRDRSRKYGQDIQRKTFVVQEIILGPNRNFLPKLPKQIKLNIGKILNYADQKNFPFAKAKSQRNSPVSSILTFVSKTSGSALINLLIFCWLSRPGILQNNMVSVWLFRPSILCWVIWIQRPKRCRKRQFPFPRGTNFDWRLTSIFIPGCCRKRHREAPSGFINHTSYPHHFDLQERPLLGERVPRLDSRRQNTKVAGQGAYRSVEDYTRLPCIYLEESCSSGAFPSYNKCYINVTRN